jgi:hypothetical protein
MTLSLRAACFDPEKDYPIIFEEMKRTSHFSGHDRAEDLPARLPTFEEINQDITDLRDFAGYAKKRNNDLDKLLKRYEAGVEVEPVLL